MNEKGESQREAVICSRPHSKTEAELDKELRCVVRPHWGVPSLPEPRKLKRGYRPKP